MKQGMESGKATAADLVKLIRPRQWVKNFFVIAPLVFSKNLINPFLVLYSLGAFVLFSLASGFVYVFNDLKDMDADRLHPVKKNRPLASGRVGVGTGKIFACVLAITALSGGWSLKWKFGAFLTGYLLLNLLYTIVLKRVPYLDVAGIALGFLLRVLAGAAVVNVKPSVWLMVCTVLLAAYLGLGKRAFELRVLGDKASEHRKVLSGYHPKHLKIALVVLGVTTLAAYFFYTLAPHTVSFFGTGDLVWTTPFPAIGLFRFGQLLKTGKSEDSPTEEMLKDPIFLINMAAWILSVLAIIYLF